MQKEEKYDWQNSNIANLGSDMEKEQKKECAEEEPAWKGLGQIEELRIWRIEQFKVVAWPAEQYGNFYQGDTYIIYKATKQPDGSLEMKLHFWIGRDSSQDEYGTAAYKVVELDTFLDDRPVQYREVQDRESDTFLSYFNKFSILLGGVDTGFNIVLPSCYKSKMYHVKQAGKQINIREIELSKQNLNKKDVYIIDLGLQMQILLGPQSQGAMSYNANQFYQHVNKERQGRVKLSIIDKQEDWTQSEIYQELPDTENTYTTVDRSEIKQKTLHRLKSEDDKLSFDLIKEDDFKKTDLDSDDVFILSTNQNCYVWIGSGASIKEKKNSFNYAHQHLVEIGHPFLPIVVFKEGQEIQEFKALVEGF